MTAADSAVLDLRDWIESVFDGKVTRFAVVSGGKSRSISAVDVERDGATTALILRRETGSGAASGTRFTLQREAGVLRALATAPVRAPKVRAVSPAGDAILMERLGGATSLATLESPALRADAIRGFCEGLADLHRIDPSALELPLKRPAHAADHALVDLADYQDSYRRLCIRHDIIDRALTWLEDHAGSAPVRTVLAHGDAGPGNFMHERGHLTGLIDWEMSHLGDAHDDLAWIWFRVNILKADREADSYFAEYRRAAHFNIDRDRLVYYIMFVITRCAIACGVRQWHDPAKDDTRPRILRELVAAALADVERAHFRELPPLPAGL